MLASYKRLIFTRKGLGGRKSGNEGSARRPGDTVYIACFFNFRSAQKIWIFVSLIFVSCARAHAPHPYARALSSKRRNFRTDERKPLYDGSRSTANARRRRRAFTHAHALQVSVRAITSAITDKSVRFLMTMIFYLKLCFLSNCFSCSRTQSEPLNSITIN